MLFCSDDHNYYYFIQVYVQNIHLKSEINQLKSSEMQLSSNLESLTGKYHVLKQEIEKPTHINDAETIMGQLERILSETESNLMKILTKAQSNFKVSFMKNTR